VKRNLNAPLWLVLFAAALLFILAACVRSVPQENPPPTSPPAIATDIPADNVQPIPPPQEMPEISTPTPESGSDAGGGTPSDPPPPTDAAMHTVQEGETLSSIANQHGITPEELAVANNLTNIEQLTVGQTLVIPAPGTTVISPTAVPPTTGQQVHVVQAGENLFRISLRYGYTVNELAAYNNIPDPSRIYVGQVILLPPR
jgi:LysM repeat protein